MKQTKLKPDEIKFLKTCYKKLLANNTYRNLDETFKDYMNEFLDKELLAIKKIKEVL